METKLALGCGKRIRQRPEVGLLHPVRVDDPSAYPAMMPGEGFVPGPGVVLGLQIGEIGEGAQGQDRAFQSMVRSTWPFDSGRRGGSTIERVRSAPKSAATS